MDSAFLEGINAFERAMRAPESKWPERKQGSNRLYPDCSPAIKPTFSLIPGESIFTIGSCFARNVERQLAARGFEVPSLTFAAPESEGFPGPISNILNKYTPQGMLNEVAYAVGACTLDAASFLCEGRPGEYSDYQLHVRGVVSGNRAIERRRQVQALFRTAITKSRVVVITLGLVEAWFDSAAGVYLNESPSYNMVKLHPGRFQFKSLDYAECLGAVRETIRLLHAARGGDLKIVLTVSPVPLQRTFSGMDVITANCHSKSLLRVVAHEVSNENDFVDYYPSYEAVVYSENHSTWLDDQVHVSDGRVAQVVSRMVEAYTREADGQQSSHDAGLRRLAV